MKQFIEKYGSLTMGTLGCFDRLIFRGHLDVSWARAMEGLLFRRKVLIKDFGRWVQEQSERVRLSAENLAHEANRPVIYLTGTSERKEDLVRKIAARDGVTEGLIAVLKA